MSQNKTQTLSTLINLSVALTPEQKDDLLRRLPTFTVDQLTALAELFTVEQETKNRMLLERFREQPTLANEYETAVTHIANQSFQSAEQSDREQNSADDILNQLNAL